MTRSGSGLIMRTLTVEEWYHNLWRRCSASKRLRIHFQYLLPQPLTLNSTCVHWTPPPYALMSQSVRTRAELWTNMWNCNRYSFLVCVLEALRTNDIWTEPQEIYASSSSTTLYDSFERNILQRFQVCYLQATFGRNMTLVSGRTGCVIDFCMTTIFLCAHWIPLNTGNAIALMACLLCYLKALLDYEKLQRPLGSTHLSLCNALSGCSKSWLKSLVLKARASESVLAWMIPLSSFAPVQQIMTQKASISWTPSINTRVLSSENNHRLNEYVFLYRLHSEPEPDEPDHDILIADRVSLPLLTKALVENYWLEFHEPPAKHVQDFLGHIHHFHCLLRYHGAEQPSEQPITYDQLLTYVTSYCSKFLAKYPYYQEPITFYACAENEMLPYLYRQRAKYLLPHPFGMIDFGIGHWSLKHPNQDVPETFDHVVRCCLRQDWPEAHRGLRTLSNAWSSVRDGWKQAGLMWLWLRYHLLRYVPEDFIIRFLACLSLHPEQPSSCEKSQIPRIELETQLTFPRTLPQTASILTLAEWLVLSVVELVDYFSFPEVSRRYLILRSADCSGLPSELRCDFLNVMLFLGYALELLELSQWTSESFQPLRLAIEEQPNSIYREHFTIVLIYLWVLQKQKESAITDTDVYAYQRQWQTVIDEYSDETHEPIRLENVLMVAWFNKQHSL